MYTLGQGPRKQDCSRRIWTQETSRQQHKSRGGTCQKCKRIHVIYIYQGCNPFTCLSSMYIDLPILPVAYIILQNLWHLGGIEQTCCNMCLYILCIVQECFIPYLSQRIIPQIMLRPVCAETTALKSCLLTGDSSRCHGDGPEGIHCPQTGEPEEANAAQPGAWYGHRGCLR